VLYRRHHKNSYVDYGIFPRVSESGRIKNERSVIRLKVSKVHRARQSDKNLTSTSPHPTNKNAFLLSEAAAKTYCNQRIFFCCQKRRTAQPSGPSLRNKKSLFLR
jgi:hypothetical protein